MELFPDFSDLLAELDRAGAEVVIVGGYAVGFHGQPRSTKDLDLFVRGDPENLARVAAALATFGASADVAEAARNMAPDEVVWLGQPPTRVDLLREIDGVEAKRVLENAVVAEIGGRRVRVISLDDLIANKRAAARPQDLLDATMLEEIRERRA